MKIFRAKAQELLPKNTSRDHNQAIMEFGSMQCVPKNPECRICPMVGFCVAYNEKLINELPVKTKKTKVKSIFHTYLVFRKNDRLGFYKRDDSSIWKGLFTPFLIENESHLLNFAEVQSLEFISADDCINPPSQEFIHLLSHRRIKAVFYIIDTHSDDLPVQYFGLNEVEKLAKPVLTSKFLDNYTL